LSSNSVNRWRSERWTAEIWIDQRFPRQRTAPSQLAWVRRDTLFAVSHEFPGSGNGKTSYLVMFWQALKLHSSFMRHSVATFPVIYGGRYKAAETQTVDNRHIESESSSAHMLVFVFAYATGMLFALAGVALLHFLRS
jgi:hypothetical protein